jgi:hypothetical protein
MSVKNGLRKRAAEVGMGVVLIIIITMGLMNYHNKEQINELKIQVDITKRMAFNYMVHYARCKKEFRDWSDAHEGK